MFTSNFGLFGTKTRTNVLLLVSLLGETYASELARLLHTSLSNVQNAVDSLEQAGVVAGAVSGRERRIKLDPRYFAANELETLLKKVALENHDLLERAATIRRRPRRSGKPQ